MTRQYVCLSHSLGNGGKVAMGGYEEAAVIDSHFGSPVPEQGID